MRQYFFDTADYLKSLLVGDEVYTAYLSGEDSDFCRFNGGRIRQAGSVKQNQLTLRLINGARHAAATVSLAGSKSSDQAALTSIVAELREQLAELPDDPYLMYATEVQSSDSVRASELPDSRDTVAQLVTKSKGLDMVGIFASGSIYRGFANSLGQRNWYACHPFNFDFSLYLRADKAVKSGYAGFHWQDQACDSKLHAAREQLEILKLTPKTIKPGKYRVYLSPAALNEVTDMLAWNGFGLKSHKTKQTSLLRMVDAGASMHESVTMLEHTAAGLSPDFSSAGFKRPAHVHLIERGQYKDCLVSPRSAKEFGVSTNGASEGESPESLEMAPGSIDLAQVPEVLGDGVYINNLWYLNYSDQSACRMTGLTRFASFWVEGGKIEQPLNVMRFDESALRMFGDHLIGLTKEREMIMSSHTYGQRSVSSVHLPGALVKDFSFTL
ncbi:MAG: TldE/PmbA family protein [Deltaproteobacteria bacterium]|nr:TldE/PmbA family protein [Deltaproteobacteria bacterium]